MSSYHHLEEAVRMNGFLTMDIVKQLVEAGYMKLWEKDNAVAATGEEEIAGKRVLTIILAGGKLNELIEIEKEIESFAIANGIHEIVINGRKGWERVLNGYKPHMVIMRKELNHG